MHEIHSLLNHRVFIHGISIQGLWSHVFQDVLSEQKLKLGMIIKENVSFFKKLCSEGSWTNWVAHFAKLKRIIVASPFPVKEYYLLREEVRCSASLHSNAQHPQ